MKQRPEILLRSQANRHLVIRVNFLPCSRDPARKESKRSLTTISLRDALDSLLSRTHRIRILVFSLRNKSVRVGDGERDRGFTFSVSYPLPPQRVFCQMHNDKSNNCLSFILLLDFQFCYCFCCFCCCC